mmetsp:Transcript_11454/g.46338  ORF Transcript_11454/g.46338 Transcript_11454/m.46338 type:complete len:476 (+) Transcript_11454:61-1488(+)
MEGAIKTLLDRLETVTARLESVEAQLGGAAPAAGGAAAAAGAGESGAALVSEYDDLISGLSGFFTATRKFANAELSQQLDAFEAGLKAQRAFLNIASQAKKPSDEVFGKLLTDTSAAVAKIISIRDSNRGNEQWNHLSTLSEAAPFFGWVQVQPTPGPFVKEYKGNAEFYSNKIRVANKGKDEDQMAFANGFSQFLLGLIDYIKKHHTTALKWNAKGEDASKFVGAAAPEAPKAAPAGGPPGPPPPVANLTPAKKGPDMNALFGELSKGTAVTSGLKKVDRSQMTHKNPALRKTAVVKAAPTKKPATRKYGSQVKKGTPKFALEGNKWVVEFQDDNKDIVIAETEAKQTVYAYKCDRSVIRIDGSKVNSICLDSCNKVGIAFVNAIATVELINCNSCEVQCQGVVPSMSVDKCSSIQLYLSKECIEKDTEVVSSKTDQLNIIIPGKDDLVELAVPEQYKTVIRNGALETNCVEHV